MNILFIGDIVGPSGAAWVAGRLPELRRRYETDLVVVNAENAAICSDRPTAGFGMSTPLVELLFGAGVDAITSGNHAWDHPDTAAVLARPNVLRPLNAPAGRAGHGVWTTEVRGEPLTLINLCDALAIPGASPHYPAFEGVDRRGTVLVDFHGESPLTKQAFAFAVDGRAAAVLGTHTHEPTTRLHRLPGGTALVSDVGMSGAYGGVAGVDPAIFVARLRGDDLSALPPFTLATGPMTLGAVFVRTEGGRTVHIERVE